MIIFALSVSFLLTGMAYFGLQCCWCYTPVNLHNDLSWGAPQTCLRSMLQLTFSGIQRRYRESTACSSTLVQSSIKSFCDAMISTHERLMIFCLKRACAVSLSSIWFRDLFTLHLKQSFDSTWLWMSVFFIQPKVPNKQIKVNCSLHAWCGPTPRILTFIFRVNCQLMEHESRAWICCVQKMIFLRVSPSKVCISRKNWRPSLHHFASLLAGHLFSCGQCAAFDCGLESSEDNNIIAVLHQEPPPSQLLNTYNDFSEGGFLLHFTYCKLCR